jgi:cell wall-associated NlpC family hydrolase
MTVNVPFTDLRAQPRTRATSTAHDPLQETQLLYGERVRVLNVHDGWAHVEAVEQAEFSHTNRWQGYPGWVLASHLTPWEPLQPPNIIVTEKWATAWADAYRQRPYRWRFPLGTHLFATDMGGELWKVELSDGTQVWLPYASARSIDEARAMPVRQRRGAILRSAQLLLEAPYFWGGRSPVLGPSAGSVTGVDCSGLTNLAYRTVGVNIPRDAHEQYLRANRISSPQPADLIFLSEPNNPQRIVHVMLYAGDGQIIEGPGTGMRVRRVSVAERLGRPLEELASGSVVDDRTVLFGSYLP